MPSSPAELVFVAPSLRVGISGSSTGFLLTWAVPNVVLQSAPSLSGPWTDVMGAASPYPVVFNSAQFFFRLAQR